jgi:hypothetical protein
MTAVVMDVNAESTNVGLNMNRFAITARLLMTTLISTRKHWSAFAEERLIWLETVRWADGVDQSMENECSDKWNARLALTSTAATRPLYIGEKKNVSMIRFKRWWWYEMGYAKKESQILERGEAKWTVRLCVGQTAQSTLKLRGSKIAAPSHRYVV